MKADEHITDVAAKEIEKMNIIEAVDFMLKINEYFKKNNLLNIFE